MSGTVKSDQENSGMESGEIESENESDDKPDISSDDFVQGLNPHILKKETKKFHADDRSVTLKEIPETPVNRFLMRPAYSPHRSRYNRVSSFERERSNRPSTSKSGRKLKGRGVMRYRTPSPSGSDKSVCVTPPHWKKEQSRVRPISEVKESELAEHKKSGKAWDEHLFMRSSKESRLAEHKKSGKAWDEHLFMRSSKESRLAEHKKSGKAWDEHLFMRSSKESRLAEHKKSGKAWDEHLFMRSSKESRLAEHKKSGKAWDEHLFMRSSKESRNENFPYDKRHAAGFSRDDSEFAGTKKTRGVVNRTPLLDRIIEGIVKQPKVEPKFSPKSHKGKTSPLPPLPKVKTLKLKDKSQAFLMLRNYFQCGRADESNEDSDQSSNDATCKADNKKADCEETTESKKDKCEARLLLANYFQCGDECEANSTHSANGDDVSKKKTTVPANGISELDTEKNNSQDYSSCQRKEHSEKTGGTKKEKPVKFKPPENPPSSKVLHDSYSILSNYFPLISTESEGLHSVKGNAVCKLGDVEDTIIKEKLAKIPVREFVKAEDTSMEGNYVPQVTSEGNSDDGKSQDCSTKCLQVTEGKDLRADKCLKPLKQEHSKAHSQPEKQVMVHHSEKQKANQNGAALPRISVKQPGMIAEKCLRPLKQEIVETRRHPENRAMLHDVEERKRNESRGQLPKASDKRPGIVNQDSRGNSPSVCIWKFKKCYDEIHEKDDKQCRSRSDHRRSPSAWKSRHSVSDKRFYSSRRGKRRSSSSRSSAASSPDRRSLHVKQSVCRRARSPSPRRSRPRSPSPRRSRPRYPSPRRSRPRSCSRRVDDWRISNMSSGRKLQGSYSSEPYNKHHNRNDNSSGFSYSESNRKLSKRCSQSPFHPVVRKKKKRYVESSSSSSTSSTCSRCDDSDSTSSTSSSDSESSNPSVKKSVESIQYVLHLQRFTFQ